MAVLLSLYVGAMALRGGGPRPLLSSVACARRSTLAPTPSAPPRPRARPALAAADFSKPAGRWTPLLWSVGVGLALALLTAAGPRAATATSAILLVWPVCSTARLAIDGRYRAALTVAVSAALRRFATRPWQYLSIPLVAGGVGWLTNKVAVEMIFRPLEFGGLRLCTWPNQPLGLVGWQGIVPCKAGMMAQRLTDMITARLLNVREVFNRLEPARVADLMAPGVDRIAEQVVREMVPPSGRGVVSTVGRAALRGLPPQAQRELAELRHQFVAGLTRDMQQNIGELVNLDEVVVGGMVREKQMLVDLFRRVGRKELQFLVDSGFGFGVCLGLVQLALWLFTEMPWTLAAGGTVVGYLTNWLALKLIFEPVEPTRLGPFTVQGLFLRRQHEASPSELERARPS